MSKGLAVVPASLLSYGLLRAFYTLFVNLHATFKDAPDVAGAVVLLASVSVFARFAADAVVALASPRLKELGGHAFATIGAPAVTTLASVLVTCSANGWLGGWPLLVAGAALLGMGAEVFFLLWGELLASLDFESAKSAVMWKMALDALLAPLFFLPGELLFVLCLVLPFASWVGYVCARAAVKADSEPRPQPWHALSTRAALPIGAGVVIMFFGFNFLQTGFQDSLAGAQAGYLPGTVNAIVGRWIALAVMAFGLSLVKDFRFSALFRVTICIAIAGFLVVTLPFDGSFSVFNACVIVAALVAENGVLLASVALSGYTQAPPILIVSLGAAATRLGGVVGVLFGNLLGVAIPDHALVALPFITSLEVILLAAAGMWLLRDETFNRLFWSRQPEDAEPSAASTASDLATRGMFLSAQFDLTQRETDVLLLLLEGRSVPYIKETLYVSANTAKTHVRHIYQKLGVHNRQDLLTLAQSTATQPDGRPAEAMPRK